MKMLFQVCFKAIDMVILEIHVDFQNSMSLFINEYELERYLQSSSGIKKEVWFLKSQGIFIFIGVSSNFESRWKPAS